MIDVSNLESIMDEAQITQKIHEFGIDRIDISELQRHRAGYDETVTELQKQLNNPLPPPFDKMDISLIRDQIDEIIGADELRERIERLTLKYFLMGKHLDSVM